MHKRNGGEARFRFEVWEILHPARGDAGCAAGMGRHRCRRRAERQLAGLDKGNFSSASESCTSRKRIARLLPEDLLSFFSRRFPVGPGVPPKPQEISETKRFKLSEFLFLRSASSVRFSHSVLKRPLSNLERGTLGWAKQKKGEGDPPLSTFAYFSPGQQVERARGRGLGARLRGAAPCPPRRC